MNSTSSRLIIGALALSLAAAAFGQTQTAQSVMVGITTDSTAYVIEGTLTWSYDRDAAESLYANAWDGTPPAVTPGSGSPQPTPAAPEPDGSQLMQHAQAQRCIFFSGGALASNTYTQTVNGTRGWKWVYTYNITPTQASVAARTCWSSQSTGGAVDVGVSGFVASESYMAQSTGKKVSDKYSFTLVDSDGSSRVQNVTIQLERFDLTTATWTLVGTPEQYQTLAVTPTTADYSYSANGGQFGNALVFAKLHAPGAKAATDVSAILTEDTFANNNNDLASGNVHQANLAALFSGLTESGSYRVTVFGAIKDNSATATLPFAVTSNLIEIGGCNSSTP